MNSTTQQYRVTNDRYSDQPCVGTLAELQEMCDAAGWNQPTTLTIRGSNVVDENGEIVAVPAWRLP